jgi:hypothetical protein
VRRSGSWYDFHSLVYEGSINEFCPFFLTVSSLMYILTLSKECSFVLCSVLSHAGL